MNRLESCIVTSPFGVDDECAKFIIDDISSPFILNNIAVINQTYTLSLWIRSENESQLLVSGSSLPTYTDWKKHIITFKALATHVAMHFNTTGTFYIYHPQLEIGNKASDWTESPEDTDDKINDVESGLREAINDQHTTILQDCEQIILGSLKSYTMTGDFEEYKKVVENQLKILSDQTTLQFTQTTTRLTEVNNVLQEQINNITKYFTFDINGLTIGQVDNPYKVIIDNDRYSMTVNDVEVMWIADGKVYTPEIEVTRAFKLFGYLIDQDQNGNVNCAYVGGE